ncbi:MAG: diacylglycerol kinase, partial [Epsilonproteobacteria bacterium]|nr:diacylglycerol kinase [Campylobacterota bacterium]
MQSQSINTTNYSYNSLGFSLQTSSGDVIDLNMYDERSASISHEQSGGMQNTMLSLSHAYGYNFHYEGDGIDENDQKEIDAAMKLIQPQIDEYLSNVQQSSET